MFKYILPLLTLIVILFVWNNTAKNRAEIKTSSELSKDEQVAKERIKIALLVPLSGEDKALGDSALKGAQLALKKINNEETKNNSINLIKIDTNSEENLTLDKNTIIIGGVNEEETKHILKKDIRDNLFLYLSDGEVFTCLNQKNKNKKIWGIGISNAMFIEPMLISLANRYKAPDKSFEIFFYSNFSESSLIEDIHQTIDSFDFERLKTEYVDIRIENLYDKVRAIFEHNPDLLIYKTLKNGRINFLKAISKLSLRSEMQIASLDIINLEQANQDTEAIWSALSYSTNIENNNNSKFIKSWNKLYPETRPSLTAVKAYNAINLVQKALEKNKHENIKEIEKSFIDLSFQAPQGEIFFSNENQLLVQPLHIGKYENNEFSSLENIGNVSNPKYTGCSME